MSRYGPHTEVHVGNHAGAIADSTSINHLQLTAVLVMQWLDVRLVIERSLVRLPAWALSSQL